ncbi:unnamed protein product [Peniophora sp. CBMAI 1063]|nr:unnamed protein product [Peniophora sp. CBMAI 1063]
MTSPTRTSSTRTWMLTLRGLQTIRFATADKNDPSKKAGLVAALLKKTPNVKRLELAFSGHLYSYKDCLGPELLEVMCSLKKLTEFEHKATTTARTDFGIRTLLQLVSSWPELRHLYIAGDTNGRDNGDDIPLPTCAIKTATFERLMGKLSKHEQLFAGSGESLEELEFWGMGYGDLEELLKPVLNSIVRLRIGGSNKPSLKCITDTLSKAPKLATLDIGGESEYDNGTRAALANALQVEGSFPSLRSLRYTAQHGTYKTGRGRNVREHEYENSGETELLQAARERGIWASAGTELEYKVEGAQRRAGIIAARGRYGGW